MDKQLELLTYDFANILFAGPCNARCPFCIGRKVDDGLNQANLGLYPPRNLDPFLDLIRHHAVREVVFTGTTTDPQLYRHEARLLAHLRRELHPETRFSLHTNGRLALRKMDVFNEYDRVCISFPSFQEETYHQVMGVPAPPDLAAILVAAQVPVKVSCVVTDANRREVPEFLRRCGELGVERLVLRKLFDETRTWSELIDLAGFPARHRRVYRHNPVYRLHGLEVTLWDFQASSSRSLNLFADGTISNDYLLTKARGGVNRSLANNPSGKDFMMGYSALR